MILLITTLANDLYFAVNFMGFDQVFITANVKHMELGCSLKQRLCEIFKTSNEYAQPENGFCY